jgi:pyridoxamine 5'-phosphate oxidase
VTAASPAPPRDPPRPELRVYLLLEDLQRQFAEIKERYTNLPVPCPPDWGGYLVAPERIEFWQGRPSRLHDRLLYTWQGDGTWSRVRLAP